MDMHGVVGYFIVIAVTALGFLFMVSWTIKSIIASQVTRRYELFRQQLQSEVGQALEQLRKTMAEEKMVFGTMMDGRSDSLVQLYGLMIDVAKNGRELSKHGLNNLPFAVGTVQTVLASAQEFFGTYQKNGIYFSDEFCAAMDPFQVKHEKLAAEFAAALQMKVATPQDEQNVIAHIQKSWGAFENDVPGAITEMKREFRRLVGGASKWW
ncbi:MAG TPA: hypothetical protein VIH45_03540 [Desulfuromonadaceae bacterium]